jgi:hypothetical protein
MSLIPNPTFSPENPGFDLIEIHPNVIRGTEADKLTLGNFQSQEIYDRELAVYSVPVRENSQPNYTINIVLGYMALALPIVI